MGPNQSHTRKVEFVANIPLRNFFLVQKLRKSFKMVFVTLEKCLGQNRSSFLKKAFLHGLHPNRRYLKRLQKLFWVHSKAYFCNSHIKISRYRENTLENFDNVIITWQEISGKSEILAKIRNTMQKCKKPDLSYSP